MAEIQIEKKHGMSPWAWLIPVLIVLALLWWWFGRDRHETSSAGDVDRSAVSADVAPITDLSTIVNSRNRASLDGRQVQLAGVHVQAVPGDEIFWVGTSATQRLMVALSPSPAGRAGESPANVNIGQQVNVSGVLRQVPADLTEMRNRWKLDEASASALTQGEIYLAAEQVTVTQPR